MPTVIHTAACVSHTGLQCDCAIVEAREDAREVGIGFTRKHPDGRVERLPPDQVTIYTRPNNQEA